jgi:hypothetical protein
MRFTVHPTASRLGWLAGTLMVPCRSARRNKSPEPALGPTSPCPVTQSCASPWPCNRIVISPAGHAPSNATTAPFVSAVSVDLPSTTSLMTAAVVPPSPS